MGINQVTSQPIARLEDFIQTWLFFGLLGEILGDLFDPAHFVCLAASTTENGNASMTSQLMSTLKKWMGLGPRKVLDTSQLVPTIDKWMSQIKNSKSSQEEKRTQFDHVTSCLRLTSAALEAVKPNVRPDFNPWIRLCIASIGELLTMAANLAYEIYFANGSKYPGNWPLLCEQPQIFDQMAANGLCPSEIHRLRSSHLTIQTQNFLTWMKKEASGVQHQNCTERICWASHNNVGQYVAKHRQDTCQCTDFLIDVPKTIEILSRGLLPLLRIKPGPALEDIQVGVVEASSDLKYIALSHVWADGLGNPYANSLPKCQLELLYELSRPFADMEHDEDILLWIDTLCCPVEPPEAKTMSLNLMKIPYTSASHVLVLENSLRDIESSGLDSAEICLRILTSGWMRRLWTLQEGALPEKLWFQFKDSVMELRQTWLEAMDTCNIKIDRTWLARDITILYHYLRSFFHSEEGDPLRRDLEHADKALQFRSVSVASDEPLLIAGLLRLDTAFILDGPEDSRMQRLWSLVPSVPQGIPKNVLFNRGSRLRQPGFRWAPASLLSFAGDRDGSLCSTDVDEYSGSLTPSGLVVHLSAFQLKMAIVPKGLPKNPWNMFSNETESTTFCRYGEGVWLQIWEKYIGAENVKSDHDQLSLREILTETSQSYKLLLASAFKLDGSQETSDALLVHDNDDHRNGAPVVISDMILTIGTTPVTAEIFLEAAYQASQKLLNDEITSQYTNLGIEDENVQKEHLEYLRLEPILSEKLFDLAKDVKDPEILAAIKANNSMGTNTFFPVFIARAYLGSYCDLGPMLPKSSEWCVD